MKTAVKLRVLSTGASLDSKFSCGANPGPESHLSEFLQWLSGAWAKNALYALLAAILFFNGCSGSQGGGSASGSSASYISESAQSENTVTRVYSADNLTAEDRAVFIVSSQQKEKDPSFNYAVSSSKQLPAYNMFVKDIISSAPEEIKDIDIDLIKYGEFINKAVGANNKDIKSKKVYSEGDEENFHILLNGSTFDTCGAKCYKAGVHCYIFIDTASEKILDPDRAVLAGNIAKAFDSDNSPFDPGCGIYDKTRSYCGSEPNPGIDGDSKIFILISPKLGSKLYGYFYSLDEIDAANSNKKEIIYANDDIFSGNMYNGLATLAHEFSHLINYNMKFKIGGSFEETFISEGSAVLCEKLNGFTLEGTKDYSGNGYILRSIDTFLKSPSSFYFFYWNKDYGAGFLFMTYIMERYGVEVFKNIQKSDKTGTDNIESCTNTSFSELFTEWMLVNYYSGLNGSPVLPSGSTRAKYDNFNPKGKYEGYSARDNGAVESYVLGGIGFKPGIVLSSAPGNQTIGQYSCNYFEIIPAESAGSVSFTYTSKSEYSTYSNFIIEKPAGTFYSAQ